MGCKLDELDTATIEKGIVANEESRHPSSIWSQNLRLGPALHASEDDARDGGRCRSGGQSYFRTLSLEITTVEADNAHSSMAN